MKKCPMCKEEKPNSDYNAGGALHNTYCKICQRIFNNNRSARTRQKILEASNDGQCWWVYQACLADLTIWRKK